MIEYLLGILVLILGFLLWRQSSHLTELKTKVEQIETNFPQMVEYSVMKTIQGSTDIFEKVFGSAISKNTNVIKGAFAESLKELGIQEDLGKLKEASGDLKKITSDLKSMFEIKSARAKFGELQLEAILKDIIPSQRLGIRKSIGREIPDAYIIVDENKYLCIDSKFPLENFKKYTEEESPSKKEEFWKNFLKDVNNHVRAIKEKYVGKENTMDFAFMFIPSDAIYYKLVSEAHELVSEAAKSGVILTSPSLLPAHISLILTKIKAEEISKRAEEVQRKINILGTYIKDLEDKFGTLTRHLNNANSNVHKVQQAINELKTYYSSLTTFELEE
ncbi:hypothetical protein OCC_04270 [Thermococcus litoralis DSM 5473]|uniref:DNA recombination protein RmuC n=1 Tax=Thermococcus litoralis (strain ATCC 51850 / DSM 5473 / JCM 8560 / NS-C) TaxID=523849 RepID=H3ZPJ9_THELN|nr:DNA recombination protein RmuC [Thermococcus litoralis]EHR78043.1 hypothetical protein OCC_04270 [Thermococcus litoralis DSM 5473]